MSYRRIIFKLYAFGLRQIIHFPHCREKFRLFYRVDTEIGFHIQIKFQHIFGVAGLFGNQINDFFSYSSFVKLLGRSRSNGGLGRNGRSNRLSGRGLFGLSMQMPGSSFIYKSLRGFHYQSGLFAGLIIIFNP